MAYLATLNELRYLRYGNEPCNQVFSRIHFNSVAQLAILHQDRVASVAHNGRIWENLAEQTGVIAFVTGFLAQLADASGDR